MFQTVNSLEKVRSSTLLPPSINIIDTVKIVKIKENNKHRYMSSIQYKHRSLTIVYQRLGKMNRKKNEAHHDRKNIFQKWRASIYHMAYLIMFLSVPHLFYIITRNFPHFPGPKSKSAEDSSDCRNE